MCETCSHFGVEPRCDNCPPKRLPSERAERLANALKRAPFVRCLQCEYQGKRLEVHTFLAPSSYACPRCMSAEALVPMMTGEPVPDSEGERLWSEANARNQVVGRANRVVSVVAVTLAFLTALALLLDLLLAPDKRSFLQ